MLSHTAVQSRPLEDYMKDRILEGFLQRQFEAGMDLSRQSDLLELIPDSSGTPHRYMARFTCKGLIRDRSRRISEADRFLVGICFPEDYLRSRDPHMPFRVLTWLGPREIWHPNISNELPFICVGRLTPGTELVYVLYQLFQIITYQKVTMVENDALNREACAWARENKHRFPIDRRPLKRRTLTLTLEDTEGTERR
jgi:hypothetical protein